MKYDEARPHIQSGDVLAWTHRGWKSWHDIKLQLVRIWTRSEFVHVGIAWVVGGRVFVIEAVSRGVRIFPLSRLLPFYWIRVGYWDADMEKEALAHVGDEYSNWQAALGAIRQLKVGADRRWQCAEFVQYLMWPKYTFYDVTPARTVSTLELGYGMDGRWVNA